MENKTDSQSNQSSTPLTEDELSTIAGGMRAPQPRYYDYGSGGSYYSGGGYSGGGYGGGYGGYW